MAGICLVLVLLSQPGAQNPPQATSAAGGGFSPSGSPAELHDLGLLARLRDPGVQPVGFSSYDRTGGNNDGFNGTYSRIRAEQGDSVLAEVDGPGVVQRIWFTHTSAEQPGLLDRKQEHIKIYIDGRDRPALDVPLERIFTGTHPHFPRPLVSEGSGGFVSYVPIPFRNGCKIVVQGLGVRFYQIGLVKLPAGAVVASFTEQPEPEVRAGLERAAALWSRPGEYESRELECADVAEYDVEGLANSSHQYARCGGVLRRFVRSRSFPPQAPRTRGPPRGCDWYGMMMRPPTRGWTCPWVRPWAMLKGRDLTSRCSWVDTTAPFIIDFRCPIIARRSCGLIPRSRSREEFACGRCAGSPLTPPFSIPSSGGRVRPAAVKISPG